MAAKRREPDILDFDSFAQRTIEDVKRLLGDDIQEANIKKTSLPKAVVPTAKELANLLRVAYEASLRSEEGDFSKLSLLWLPHPHLPATQGSDLGFLTTRFRDPDAFSELSLAKLAPLCSPNGSFLILGKESGKRSFVIWGLCDVRVPPEKGDLKSRLGIAEHPYALAVVFYSPGMFDVKWHGRFIRGWPSTEDPNYLSDDKLGLFSDASAQWRDLSEETNVPALDDCRLVFYTVLEIVVGQMVSFRKGGTLLFVQEHSVWTCKPGIQHSFPPSTSDHFSQCLDFVSGRWTTCADGGCGVAKCLASEAGCPAAGVLRRLNSTLDANTEDGDLRQHGDFRYHIQFVASWIANFTRLDGAVVLTDQLRLLGFAAKIDAVNGGLVSQSLKRFLQHHGTRHKSAALWVAADPTKAVRSALVVSQDGSAHAFYWKSDKRTGDRLVHFSAIVYEEV